MQIPPNKIQKNLFLGRAQQVTRPQAVETHNYRSPINSMTPQSHHYGAVSQLINSKYLFELRKEVKKVLRGKKLQEVLTQEYTEEEFDNLPQPLKTLITFDRSISTAEVLQFMEAMDQNHEITFRDYNFDRIKFRALFEALGQLVDVEMQAGPSTFVPLSENFEIKKKIKEVFSNLRDNISDKLKSKLRLKKKKSGLDERA